MSDELKPVPCGCGGEAELEPRRSRAMYMCYALRCPCCGIEIRRKTESEVITAWNKAMGAKDTNVPYKFATDIVGNKVLTAKVKNLRRIDGGLWYVDCGNCGNCGNDVNNAQNFCPHCGASLWWDKNE